MEFTTIKEACKATGLSYLGNVNKSAKLAKNGKISGQYTYSIYLAPASQSGYNTCSHSTPECRTSGRAGMELLSGKTMISDCRQKKTRLFYENPAFFMQWLIAELQMYRAKALRDGYGFSVRLNCTSDIDWHNVRTNGVNLFEMFPDVLFYDYTKNPNKFFNKASNYHLTFSHTGHNWHACEAILKAGGNVAVVFDTKKNQELPAMYRSYKVVNGDLTDYRPDDPQGVIVGLRWKLIADKQVQKQILNSVFVVKAVECEAVNLQELEVIAA